MKKDTNYITEILGHDISWFVRNNSYTELDESTIEHIEKCIKDECSQGELVVTYGKNYNKETTGWWYIINWRDIACELNNAIDPKSSDQAKKARQRFNKEWTF